MKTFTKITLIVIGVIVILAGGFFVLLWNKLSEWDTSPIINEYAINFEELNEKIYIRTKAWGLTGDHYEILLSTVPIARENRGYVKEKDFIFYASEIYYKKQGTDTLLLYVNYKSEVPQKLSTKINIIQVELKNYDEVIDYKNHYKEYGLSRGSIYKDK